MENDYLEAFNDALEKVAKALSEAVKTAVPNATWKCARFHDTGNFSKLRIEMRDGTVVGIDPPAAGEFLDPLDRLWDMRSRFPDKWEMLELTIHPNGQCDLQLKYEFDKDFFKS